MRSNKICCYCRYKNSSWCNSWNNHSKIDCFDIDWNSLKYGFKYKIIELIEEEIEELGIEELE